MSVQEVYKLNFNSSLAHIIGNVTTLVLEHYKRQFPTNFFKSYYINTTMNSREFIKRRKTYLDLKPHKPILSVNPNLSTDRPEFASTSFFNNALGKNIYDPRGRNAVASTLFFDKDLPIMTDFSINRIKLNLDIVQTYETVIQQYNAFGIMNSSLRLEHDYKETMLLEVQIPDVIIEDIKARANKHNITQDEFVKYLNSIAQYPIQYKLKTSNGKKCYFMLINTIIQIRMETPSLGDGERKNMITDNFEISHTISLEFNYVDCFYHTTKTPVQQELVDSFGDNLMSDLVVVPAMTTTTGMVIPQRNEEGKSFYTASELLIDTMYDERKDTTDISGLFTVYDLENIKTVARIEGIKFSDVIKKYYSIEFYKEDQRLEEADKDGCYIFDYETLEITVIQPELFCNYVILIFRDNVGLNAALASQNIYDTK